MIISIPKCRGTAMAMLNARLFDVMMDHQKLNNDPTATHNEYDYLDHKGIFIGEQQHKLAQLPHCFEVPADLLQEF